MEAFAQRLKITLFDYIKGQDMEIKITPGNWPISCVFSNHQWLFGIPTKKSWIIE